MSKIRHPKLDVVSEIESLDLVFAREAYETLNCYGKVDMFGLDDNTVFNCITTDRIDIDAPNDGLHAFRLRAMPAIELPSEGPLIHTVNEDENGLMAILLEGYDLPPDWAQKYPDSEGIPWEGYVVVIIDLEDKDVPLLLSAQNGEELTDADAFKALQVLRHVRDTLRVLYYDEDDDNVGQGFSITKNEAQEFEPGRFIHGYACDECQLDYTHCNHKINLGSLN